MGLPDPLRKHGLLDPHGDLDRLETALGRLFSEVPTREAGAKAGPGRILNLACGESRETMLLRRMAARMAAGREKDVDIIGIDIRWREIMEARARAARTGGTFLAGDASRLEKVIADENDFSLVFLRHQNVWHQQVLWRRIFEGGLGRLSPDGLLVVTSYFTREHELAIKAIEEAGGTLVANLVHEDSRDLSFPGKSVDKHLAAFRLDTGPPGR
jgi:hypothetical protein